MQIRRLVKFLIRSICACPHKADRVRVAPIRAGRPQASGAGMPYPSASIANAFLRRARKAKQALDPMKIQKLLYYANGYYLAKTDAPLVDEYFEAWKFGPVLPSLYYEFQKFGADGIKAWACDPDSGQFAEPPDEPLANKVVDFVWQRFGGLDATDLSRRTHKKGSPWERVISAQDGVVYRNTDIPTPYIKEYFSRLVK